MESYQSMMSLERREYGSIWLKHVDRIRALACMTVKVSEASLAL